MRSVVRESVAQALDALRRGGWSIPEKIDIVLERPKRAEHGDLATGLAMTLTKSTGRKPREIAEAIAQELRAQPDGPVSHVDIAGPGFLNLRVRDAAFHSVIDRVFREGDRFGHSPSAPNEPRMMVEFVSANPTGPMHLAHARGAVVGDVMVRLLRASGRSVATEFYINDAGAQVLKLAASVRALARGEAVPEDGYAGEYVHELAAAVRRDRPDLIAADDARALAAECTDRMMANVRGTLTSLDVRFDVFFSERSLTTEAKLTRTLDTLRERGFLEEKDGALFFKTSAAGEEDKDRVIRKSNGDLTYFAADIAYHQDKLLRGFTHLIDVWGADHHGYVPRMRAGLEALGLPKSAFEVLLMQMVTLLKDGKPVKFSKRAGNFVTIDEVLEEIDTATGHAGSGRDAVRFLFLLRSHDSPIEFDLDVAKKQSVENPVFYAQMSHARMCSILDRVRTSDEMSEPRARGVLNIPSGFDAKLAEKLTLPEERDILALCDAFPELVREAAVARAPHRIVFFVQELAQAFASYFTRMQKVHNEPVLPQKSFRDAHPDWVSAWDWEKSRARLMWLQCVRQVYANALALVGVEAPLRMQRAESVEAQDG